MRPKRRDSRAHALESESGGPKMCWQVGAWGSLLKGIGLGGPLGI